MLSSLIFNSPFGSRVFSKLRFLQYSSRLKVASTISENFSSNILFFSEYNSESPVIFGANRNGMQKPIGSLSAGTFHTLFIVFKREGVVTAEHKFHKNPKKYMKNAGKQGKSIYFYKVCLLLTLRRNHEF